MRDDTVPAMIAYRAPWVLPIHSPPIQDGIVLVDDGEVAGLGPTSEMQEAAAGADLHELPDSIRDLMRCSDTVMMKMHGSISLGSNLMDAFKKLDMLEHTAKILYLAHTLRGGLDPLPPEAVERLLQTRKLLGIDTTNTLENRCGL